MGAGSSCAQGTLRGMRALVAALGIVLCAGNPARCVIISSGDGSGNTAAPAGLPEFDNVGVRGSGSAVYLGSGWVLTAAHVGAGATLLDNTWYSAVPGSAVQLANPKGDGYTANSDLTLYQIYGTPNLPSIEIASAAPKLREPVTMVGYGRDRTSSEAFWTSSWTPATSASPYAGFIWQGTDSMRWGTNTISATDSIEMVGTNSQMSFTTTFTGATSSDAQGAPGDSGGAVFAADPATGLPELVGIMSSIWQFPGQLWGTSVFGDLTYSADLSVYRTEIYQAMALPGDVNFDGVVNGLDLAIVASQWSKTGAGASTMAGDANHDGIVNGLDVAYVVSHWTGAEAQAAITAVPVPEPPARYLMMVGAVTWGWARAMRGRSPGVRKQGPSRRLHVPGDDFE